MSVPSLGNCVPQAHGSGDFTFPLFSGHPQHRADIQSQIQFSQRAVEKGRVGYRGKGQVHWSGRKRRHLDQRRLVASKCLLSPSLGSASSLCTAIAEAAARALQANSGGFTQGLWKVRMGWFMSVKLTLCLCPHYGQQVHPRRFMAWSITQLERPLDLRDSFGSGPFRSAGKQPWVCGSSSSARA